MSSRGKSFLKGGLGCLGIFLLLGFVAVLAGGSMHLDAGGVILLLLIGGGLGLIGHWIYQKGVHDAEAEDETEDW
ncbi:MAG: hypothetical protein Q7Q71_16580 [Verrucomicrobiota bacterium JB023]|nr:hypothetical protein [Verrucomicrobiota bacterium JB023]